MSVNPDLGKELRERMHAALSEDGHLEPLQGVHLHHAIAPRKLHGVSKPGFCLIAQGSKEIFLGNERYQYDPENYLLATSELPIMSQIIEASKAKPYLSLRLELDASLISSVMVEAGQASQLQEDVRAFDVSALDSTLLDAVLRLLRLMDTPRDRTFLVPLIKREIIYRLLRGEQGNRLRQIATLGGQSHRIGRAIQKIRQEFDQTLSIEDIASELSMSNSSFHHHFKAVTAMSPLQFQKKLRLQEARRLMLSEQFDAASAGYQVGYEDASHFSRDYKRLFGQPPMRDVAQLRSNNEGSVAATV